MIKLNIIGGSIGGTSGFDSHIKSLVNALNEEGADVRWDANKYPNWERLVTNAELNMITKPYDPKRISLLIAQPPLNWLHIGDGCKRFGTFVISEGDKIPPYWVEHLLDS